MRIALDMDGFLADFCTPFTKKAVELGLLGTHYSTDAQPDYDFKFNTEPVWRAVDDTPNWWMTAPAIFNADEAQLLNNMTGRHQVHIITNRKDKPGLTQLTAKEQIYYWLIGMNISGVRMTDIHTGSHRGDKGKLAARLGIQLAGDDMVENLEDYRNAGIHAVCLDWSYNKIWDGPRVSNLSEFVDHVNFMHEGRTLYSLSNSRVSLTAEGDAWQDTGRLPV